MATTELSITYQEVKDAALAAAINPWAYLGALGSLAGQNFTQNGLSAFDTAVNEIKALQTSSLSEAQRYRELANVWDRLGNGLTNQISGMRDQLSETQRAWADKALNNLNDSSRLTNLIENASSDVSVLREIGGELAKQMGGLLAVAQLADALQNESGQSTNDIAKAAFGIGIGIAVGMVSSVGLGAVAAGVIAGFIADAAWDIFAKDIFDADLLNANFWDVLFDFYLGGNVSGLFDSAQRATPRRDPLTFDLDGDGLETVGTATSSVYFDHDADGVKTRTGWVAADDGLLVLDRNGNGTIDNGTELFGDATPMSAASGGGRARDGFVALRQQDTNSDGVVNASDANWASLRIWQDTNQDGISQAAELRTLASLNISGINVTPTSNSQVLPDGNRIADLGTFTRSNGTTGTLGDVGQMADIDLQQNTFDSRFIDKAAPLDLIVYANNAAQYPCALPGRNAW
jgi:hypothetical protein